VPGPPGGAARAIQGLRAEIDALDDRLLELLNARARVAVELGRLKAEAAPDSAGLRLRDREAEVLGRLGWANAGPLPDRAVARIFDEIFRACLKVQAPGP
jgi:chorismate mutase/prephenate dehydratase